MEQQIVQQLIELNKKDIIDIIGAIVPLLLTIVIIVQNAWYARRDDNLQRRIHNRDCYIRYHDDILRIYNSYYDFCDVIYKSNFVNSVRYGDTNFAFSYLPKLEQLRERHVKLLDLTKLMFSRSAPYFLSMMEQRLKCEIEIVDRYIDYIMSESFVNASDNAWEVAISSSKYKNPVRVLNKYDYTTLAMDKDTYNNFLTLCKTKELQAIEELLKKDIKDHEYSQYDAYFEKYISIEKL